MKQLLPIGLSDYKRIIDDNYYYVDKTLFIDDILKYGGNTTLIPRPRRFGKTLNLSMLQYFFEKTEQSNAYLFEDKKIWQMPECAALQGKFPVIFITFKDIKKDTWQSSKKKIIEVIAKEYGRHRYILDNDQISTSEKKYYQQIVDQKASAEHYESSLQNLSEFLYRVHRVRPIVLLDEYDAPIHAGFLHNYYSQVLQFIRSLMSGVFKDNKFLERGVITGILRTAKEDFFSGLNNLEIFTIIDDFMSDKFGFTQEEVEQLLQAYDLFQINQNFKNWYNGYLIGTVKIYNPLSALSCVKWNGVFTPYWVNTNDNALIYKVVAQAGAGFKDTCADLIMGNVVKNIEITKDIIFPKIMEQAGFIWSLLLFSGYVTPQAHRIVKGKIYADLKLPNEELHLLFTKLVEELFYKNLQSVEITTLYETLLNANGTEFSKIVSTFVVQSMSYYDIPADEPEKSYHLFVLGLLVVLADKYQVLSNLPHLRFASMGTPYRESGFGRFDIMLIPSDKNIPGIIIEFKKLDDTETMAECAERALEQIKKRNYAAQLVQQNVKKIVDFGIALHKKEVLLKQEEL